jgi:hypothetical protein
MSGMDSMLRMYIDVCKMMSAMQAHASVGAQLDCKGSSEESMLHSLPFLYDTLLWGLSVVRLQGQERLSSVE